MDHNTLEVHLDLNILVLNILDNLQEYMLVSTLVYIQVSSKEIMQEVILMLSLIQEHTQEGSLMLLHTY